MGFFKFSFYVYTVHFALCTVHCAQTLDTGYRMGFFKFSFYVYTVQ